MRDLPFDNIRIKIDDKHTLSISQADVSYIDGHRMSGTVEAAVLDQNGVPIRHFKNEKLDCIEGNLKFEDLIEFVTYAMVFEKVR